MQKLTQNLVQRLIKDEKGSTIVGAVVICAIMAIGISGLMSVSRNTISQEADAHNEVRAFQAAEGGLLMLANWAMQNDDGPALGEGNLTIDDIPVTVEIRRPADWPIGPAADDHRWLLRSTADLAGERGLAYIKRLEWNMEMLPGVPGAGAADTLDQSDCDVPDPNNTGPSHIVHGLGQGNYIPICIPPYEISIWLEIPPKPNHDYDDNWRLGAVVGVENVNDVFCDYTLGLGGNGQHINPMWGNTPDAPNSDARRDYSTDLDNDGFNRRSVEVSLWGGTVTTGDNGRMSCDHRSNVDRGQQSSHANSFMPRRGNFVGPITLRSFMVDANGNGLGVRGQIVLRDHQGHFRDSCDAGDCYAVPTDGEPTLTATRWNEFNDVRQ
ncbi:MAG: pilus assembly PilX N-terminal domain-containing protein [Chitinispirillales bacterium]|jgi:Flp pilus assembly pilin Flp|nr:pilus assembly PilX N-terminal domain-containing protein [Chitinispirillales bacterium]